MVELEPEQKQRLLESLLNLVPGEEAEEMLNFSIPTSPLKVQLPQR